MSFVGNLLGVPCVESLCVEYPTGRGHKGRCPWGVRYRIVGLSKDQDRTEKKTTRDGRGWRRWCSEVRVVKRRRRRRRRWVEEW